MTPSIRFAWCTKGSLHRSFVLSSASFAYFLPSPRYFRSTSRTFIWWIAGFSRFDRRPCSSEILSGKRTAEFVSWSLYHFILRNGKPYAWVGAMGLKALSVMIHFYSCLLITWWMIVLLRRGSGSHQDYLNPKGLWQFRRALARWGFCWFKKELTEIWRID